VIVVLTELLVVASMSHDGCHSLFLKAVKFGVTSFLDFTFYVELYAWSSKGDKGL
jgi:hypothetical protein